MVPLPISQRCLIGFCRLRIICGCGALSGNTVPELIHASGYDHRIQSSPSHHRIRSSLSHHRIRSSPRPILLLWLFCPVVPLLISPANSPYGSADTVISYTSADTVISFTSADTVISVPSCCCGYFVLWYHS